MTREGTIRALPSARSAHAQSLGHARTLQTAHRYPGRAVIYAPSSSSSSPTVFFSPNHTRRASVILSAGQTHEIPRSLFFSRGGHAALVDGLSLQLRRRRKVCVRALIHSLCIPPRATSQLIQRANRCYPLISPVLMRHFRPPLTLNLFFPARVLNASACLIIGPPVRAPDFTG